MEKPFSPGPNNDPAMLAATKIMRCAADMSAALPRNAESVGICIDLHAMRKRSTLSKALLSVMGCGRDRQLCLEGDSPAVRRQMRQLIRDGVRAAYAAMLFELHEDEAPSETLKLARDLVRGGVLFIADYAMRGLDPADMRILAQSDAEQELQAKIGWDAWARQHSRHSAGDIDGWARNAGFRGVSLDLPGSRSLVIAADDHDLLVSDADEPRIITRPS